MKTYILDLNNNSNREILLDYYNDLDYYYTMVAKLRKLKREMDAEFIGYDSSYIDEIIDGYIKLYNNTKEGIDFFRGLLGDE